MIKYTCKAVHLQNKKIWYGARIPPNGQPLPTKSELGTKRPNCRRTEIFLVLVQLHNIKAKCFIQNCSVVSEEM